MSRASLTCKAPYQTPKSEVYLILAVALAVLTGLLRTVLPADIIAMISDYALTPVSEAFMRVLGAFVRFMIFFSVISGICSIESLSDFSKMGRHLSSRMIIRTFIGTGISALIMLPFHQFGQGEITEGTSQIGKIIELVFSIFPGDLITPFVEGNMLQIIFLAVMVGVVMLILGDKVDKSEKLIDLSKITVPTLVICGSNDPYLNFELVNNSIKALPEGSELEIIEGGAHVIMYEKPYYKEFQNKLSEFLVK